MEIISRIMDSYSYFFNYISSITFNFDISALMYTWGFLWAVILAHRPIRLIVSELHGIIPNQKDAPGSFSDILGYAERALFFAFFLLLHINAVANFIVYWMIIKASINVLYSYKSKDFQYIRSTYNIFLIGNALNILFSLVGAYTIKLYEKGLVLVPVVCPVILYMLSWLLYYRIETKNRSATKGRGKRNPNIGNKGGKTPR